MAEPPELGVVASVMLAVVAVMRQRAGGNCAGHQHGRRDREHDSSHVATSLAFASRGEPFVFPLVAETGARGKLHARIVRCGALLRDQLAEHDLQEPTAAEVALPLAGIVPPEREESA